MQGKDRQLACRKRLVVLLVRIFAECCDYIGMYRLFTSPNMQQVDAVCTALDAQEISFSYSRDSQLARIFVRIDDRQDAIEVARGVLIADTPRV